jgi:YVTN family beta-propeller protein
VGPALTAATPSSAAGQRPAARAIAGTHAIAAAQAIAAVGGAAAARGIGGSPGRGLVARSAGRSRAGVAVAAPGSNLLANGGAEAGAVSGQGWDAVTIPGWHVRRGLPTVVRYGTRGFPGRADAGTLGRGRQLFAGGAGGTAELIQRIPLRTAAGKAVPPGSRFRLSAWLGGTRTAAAELRVRFFSAAGRPLGCRRIGPVGRQGSPRHPDFARRQRSGLLPAGARSAEVRLVLATSLTDDDGPDAPVTGYDRAVADSLHFSVSFPLGRPPALVPPAAHVPRFDHVFLFYFENEDYGKIIGNTRQAPYLNSLLPRSSVLGNFFAEEHPSDGNYLALAGGSTFGIPLDDPLEENPHYTISARNIGDLVDAAHESWKGYLQSANGPCDDTVHSSYWDDDLPFLYFRDIRERPRYCAAHLVPLASLPADLEHAASTPDFAWISPNDCADMEGCGIRAGDSFLQRTLSAILRSPAWTTQRSLAIITFDEDGYDHEHPAQRVPTIILGSQGVRRGYVSPDRYTHYSLLRTIEAALRLGTLTANDRYAQPVNDIFTARGPQPAAAAAPPAQAPAPAAAPPAPPAAAPPRAASRGPDRQSLSRAHPPTAFVVNSGSGTVTPVDMITRRAGKPIRVGTDPQAIAITPDGRTAFVANADSGTVTPVDTVTRRAARPIRVGADPRAIVITPDGRTAFVANAGSGTVTPIDIATRRAGPPITVGATPLAMAITPDGRTLYVANWEGGSITPISTRTSKAGHPIRVGSFPVAIAITPGGQTAYVVNYGSDTVTPVATRTSRAGRPIPVGQAPDAIAVTPDGKAAYVVDGDSDAVTPIVTATGDPGRRIAVGYAPAAVTISRSGRTAYVVNTISGTVTPIAVATGRASRAIPVGRYGYPLVIALGPGGRAEVLDTYAGQVTPVDTATGHSLRRITVGGYPVAVAIAP